MRVAAVVSEAALMKTFAFTRISAEVNFAPVSGSLTFKMFPITVRSPTFCPVNSFSSASLMNYIISRNREGLRTFKHFWRESRKDVGGGNFRRNCASQGTNMN